MKGCRRVTVSVLLVLIFFHVSVSPVLASNIGTDQVLDSYQPDVTIIPKPQLVPQTHSGSGPTETPRNPDGSVVGSPYENVPDSQLTTEQVAAKYGVAVADPSVLQSKKSPSAWERFKGFVSSTTTSAVKETKKLGNALKNGLDYVIGGVKIAYKATKQVVSNVTKSVASTVSNGFKSVSGWVTSAYTNTTNYISNAWLDFKSAVVKMSDNSSPSQDFFANIWRVFQNAIQNNPTNYANKTGDAKAADYKLEKNGGKVQGKPDFGNKSTDLSKNFNFSKDNDVKTVERIIAQSLIQDFSSDEKLGENKKVIDALLGVQIYDGELSITKVKLSSPQLIELKTWISKYRDANAKALRESKNETQRLFINAMYVSTLRAQKYNNHEINDLDVYSGGADFISKYYGESASERQAFQIDLATVFSRRQGSACLFSGRGCLSSDQSLAYFVQANGGTGFTSIVDDSTPEDPEGNLAYHMTGLGINFGFADDESCSLIAKTIVVNGQLKNVPAWPLYDCLTPEEWSVYHETFQIDSDHITGEQGSSYQDLVASLLASKLGEDLRNGKIKVADFGNEIKKRLGADHHYDVCKDILPLIPKNDRYWKEISCDELKKGLNL